MIPKIIHQIWSDIDEPLPSIFRTLSNTWREYHPEWRYEFWDNDRMTDFIRSFYPQYEDVYNRFPYSEKNHLIFHT